jgi:crotonobetainyl-CoA:carnitine CoA-transferase CaiB-like acyl-CoA transferase
MAQPYEGTRVLDFTQGIAGPLATMLLADFGADVVKVEPPGGDRLKDHPGGLTWNRNKRRVTLDVHTYPGLAAAQALIARADVVVSDAAPGELERLGLDGRTLTAADPHLLHVWMPPHAAEGRWSYLPPDDMLLAATTAAAHMQMSFTDVPVYLVTPQLSYGHGLAAACAIGAGIYQQLRSGRGDHLTVSGLHGVAAIQTGGHLRAGNILRIGGRTSRGGIPNYRLYECADGKWFFLGCLMPAFFLKALEALDLMDVMALEGVDGEFSNLLAPPVSGQVQAVIEARLRERPREEWITILRAADVPCGAVGTREDWFAGDIVRANEMRVELEHPRLGTVAMPGVAAKLSDTPGSVRSFAQAATPGEVLDSWPARGAIIPEGPTPAAPLEGVRVLEFGAIIAGPYAATILASFGADAVKVESPDGDPFRPYGLGFVGYNQGKRSLVLDLKQKAGLDTFMELVRRADVVVDNFRTGVRDRMGTGYRAISAVNPRIISCSVSGYAAGSPRPGFDPLVQAESGIMDAQGAPHEPVFHQIPVNDTASALMAAFGTITALVAREHTGRGQDVLTCLANQSVICQSGELTTYAGRLPAPRGGVDFIGPSALRRFYQCADDAWVALACTRPAHFHAMAVALGHPEWCGRTIAERALDETADGPLAEAIAAGMREHTASDVVDRLLRAGVPAAPCRRPDAFFADPWQRQNHHLWAFNHPQFGDLMAVRGYSSWGRWHGGFVRRAPLLGEHSIEVLEECGLTASRVAELVAAGVLLAG